MLIFVLAAAAANSPLPEFMSGCWKMIEGDHWTQECWMEPKGGVMLGASREGRGDTLKSWEHLRIGRSGDAVTLFASPSGRTALPFKARSVSATSVEFVNPSHDYPQRISYQLKDGRLEAEISLIDGGKPIRWAYIRETP